MKALYLLPVVILLSGCETISPTKTTVLAQPGAAATAVTANQEAEILALKAHAVATEEKNKEYLKIGAAAAGNVHGVLVAAEHVEAGPPKEAVVAEATLAQDALALRPGAPAELVAAYSKAALDAERRVNLVLTGQRDEARKAYEGAKSEVQKMREVLATKEAEIDAKRQEILKIEAAKANLVKAQAAELEENRKAQQRALDAKDEALVKYKADVASKERKFWINGIRIICGLLILVGVVAIALTKGEAIVQGGIMVGCGIAGIFLAVGFDILTSQSWFAYAFGSIALIAAVAFGWWLWYQWRTHQLYRKQSEAIQDAHDEAGMAHDVVTETAAPFGAPAVAEAVEKRKTVWNELEKHLKFRLGGKDSPLGKEMSRRLIKRGLDETSTAAATK